MVHSTVFAGLPRSETSRAQPFLGVLRIPASGCGHVKLRPTLGFLKAYLELCANFACKIPVRSCSVQHVALSSKLGTSAR
jgi:hypothetical protein